MKEQEFLKHYAQNAQHLAWFLGAGTSRTSGLPTASDITWDLKRKLYCAEENQDIQVHDVGNKAIQGKIQAYMDSRGFPPRDDQREYSFYFEKMFGTDYAAQQQYLSKALATNKISHTIGQRALAALIDLSLARLIFTTNFDEVVESAVADIAGKSLTAFHLEGSYAALEALNADRYPIYAKVHGDFRYQSIKNLSADLLANDNRIQSCFVAAAARFGLVVTGYSGRDENVIRMFRRAIDQNNSFPHGLFWTTTRLSTVLPQVIALVDYAKTKGIAAHIVETGTFDEMLSKIWRQIPIKTKALDIKVRTAAAAPVSIELPAPGNTFPVLRTNALLITKTPETCGTVVYADAIAFPAVLEKIREHSPSASIAVTDRLLFWGKNEEITKVLDQRRIRSFESFRFEDVVDSISKSTYLKSFFEKGVTQALSAGKPLLLRQRNKTYYAIPEGKAATQEIFLPLRKALGSDGQLGSITGQVSGIEGLTWTEAVSLKLEVRNNALWVLIRPEFWVWPKERRDEATDFLKRKRIRRFNNTSNDILNAWISILLGTTGCADTVEVTAYADADYAASFEISTRTGFSRSAAHV